MSEAIIVALITLAGTIITVVITNRHTIAELDKKSELSDSKIQGEINVIKNNIETLSDRVEKHNSMIERVYQLEGRMNEVEHELKKGA